MTLTPEDFAGWEPHRPPWYPEHLPNPWVYVNTMSDAGETNYSKWCDSLPEGELVRLIAEHRARVAVGEVTP